MTSSFPDPLLASVFAMQSQGVWRNNAFKGNAAEMSTDIEVKLSMFAEKSLEMYYFTFMADRAVFIKNYVTCIIVKKKN